MLYKGVDWEIEKSKLDRRFQRRREKKQNKLSKISLAADVKFWVACLLICRTRMNLNVAVYLGDVYSATVHDM